MEKVDSVEDHVSEDKREANELYYDEEIAPLLADLALKLKEKGMSTIFCVENSGDVYHTSIAIDDKNPAMRTIKNAVKAMGNADILILRMLEDGKKYGHGSIFLDKLERPAENKK